MACIIHRVTKSQTQLNDFYFHFQNYVGFPGDSAGKESACNTGDPSSIPGLGRSPGEGKGYPFQYSGLENSLDCICIVHGVSKSCTRLSDFHFCMCGEGEIQLHM